MDAILTEFIQRTKADPSLAQDLLDATQWDLEAAIAAFESFNITYEPQQYEEDFSLNEYDNIDIGDVLDPANKTSSHHGAQAQEEEGSGDQVMRRKRQSVKVKGIARVADEVRELFIKVAVSDTKLVAGSNKEQVFDEQFFQHSFLFPDLTLVTPELRDYITDSLLEKSHKVVLERSGRLNWWASTGKLPQLNPLATSGDGNCLLHAASIYMWGLPDKDLILRTHLHRLLTTGVQRHGLQRRWKHSTNLRNQEAGGLTFSDEEWEFEWSEIMRIATNHTRRRPTTDSLRRYSTLRPHYESLEEIHVYALANVLRRPIIIVADEFLRDLEGECLAPIYFGGIYLPLECSYVSCFKSPLVLAYDSSHFSPLVATKHPAPLSKSVVKNNRFTRMDSRQDTVIPLVSPNGALLPIQFLYDPKTKMIPERFATKPPKPEDFPQELIQLLEGYLDVRWIQLNIGGKWAKKTEDRGGSEHFPVEIPRVRFPAAVISCLGEPQYQTELVDKYLADAQERFADEAEKQKQIADQKAKQSEEFQRLQNNRLVPCEGDGCTMFGKPANNNLCSVCYAKQQQGRQPMSPPPPYTSEYSNPSTSSVSSNTIPVHDDPSHEDPRHSEAHPLSPARINPQSPSRINPQSPSRSHSQSPKGSTSQSPKTSTSQSPRGSISSPLCSPVRSPSLSSNTSPLAREERDSPSRQVPLPPAQQKSRTADQPLKQPPVLQKPSLVKKQVGGRRTGYSRDGIKPILMSADENSVSSPAARKNNVRCRNLNCEFFGSPQYDGYCSQCKSNGQLMTDV